MLNNGFRLVISIFSKATNGILLKIGISYLLFLTLILLFNNYSSRTESYSILLFAALVALIYLSFASQKYLGTKVGIIIIVGFLFKLFIGYIFWELYLFPDYFSNADSEIKFAHFEYLHTDNLMLEIAKFRINNGFFSFSTEWLVTKHIYLHYIMSNLYLTGNFHPLDISIQNTLFSTYTSILIASFVKLLGGEKKYIKWALILSIYQPFSMISSTISRNIVGQFFVILGLFLLFNALRKSNFKLIAIILLASMSMYLERLIYVVFPTIIAIIYLFFNKKGKFKILLIAPILLGLISLILFLFVGDNSVESYSKNISRAIFWIFFPINILRLFIGPFPWTNWFDFDDNSIFLISDYMQAVVNVTFVSLIIKYFFKNKLTDLTKENYLFFIVSFSLFMFSALGTVDIHLGYMSIGTVMLIPVLVQITNPIQLNISFVIVLALFLAFNVILIATGIAGHGIGTSFR
jgi:hypothetical protein